MQKVTDPEIIRRLEESEGAPMPGFKRVTDPAIIHKLEGRPDTVEMGVPHREPPEKGPSVLDSLIKKAIGAIRPESPPPIPVGPESASPRPLIDARGISTLGVPETPANIESAARPYEFPGEPSSWAEFGRSALDELIEQPLIPRRPIDPHASLGQNLAQWEVNLMSGAAELPLIPPKMVAGMIDRLIYSPTKKVATERGEEFVGPPQTPGSPYGTAIKEEAKGLVDMVKSGIPGLDEDWLESIFSSPDGVVFGKLLLRGIAKGSIKKASDVIDRAEAWKARKAQTPIQAVDSAVRAPLMKAREAKTIEEMERHIKKARENAEEVVTTHGPEAEKALNAVFEEFRAKPTGEKPVITERKPIESEVINKEVEENMRTYKPSGIEAPEGIKKEVDEFIRTEGRPTKPKETTPQLRYIKERIEYGEAGGRIFDQETSQFAGAYSSTFPKWFTNKGYKKKEVLSAVNKAIEGKPLTDKQMEIVERLLEDSAKEFEAIGRKELDPSTLQEGQQVIIEGERYTKKTDPETGDVILKDGETIRRDAFDPPIQVDEVLPAKKQGVGAAADVGGYAKGKKPTEPLLKPSEVKEVKPKATQRDLFGVTPGAEVKKAKPVQQGLESIEKEATREALKGKVPSKELGETPLERAQREAEGRRIEAEERDRQAVISGTLPEVSQEAGFVKLSPMEEAARSWREFWSPLSTLKGSEYLKEARGKMFGGLDRVESIVKKQWNRTKNLPPEVKHDIFRFLDGQIPKSALPENVRSMAGTMQNVNNIIGRMLVKRGLLSEEAFNAHRSQYVRYLYLKHILGDKMPIKTDSSGRLDLSYLKNRKDLSKEQRRAIGLVEDVSVAVPVGLKESLSDIVKFDFFEEISQNPAWVWKPSIVKVGNRSMGIGALAEEVKIMKEVHAQAPKVPEIKARLDSLENALNKAIAETKNLPDDYVQLPTSKSYGPLSGAFVKKPVARDIMPLFGGMTGKGVSGILDTIINIETKGLAAFKVGKVALNAPTAARNVVSNVFQMNMSGVPIYEIPYWMEKALVSMVKKDKVYVQAKRRGAFKTNWAQAEIKAVLDTVRTLEKKPYPDILKGLSKVAEQYGKIDDFFRVAKFHERLAKGDAPGKAMIEAQKWAMDYSLVHPSIKFLRKHITPFITYQYKITPLIAESLTKRPWVIGKYVAVPYLMAEYVKHKLDISEDEWKQLRRDLPYYIKESGSYMVLPWKSPEGKVQWVNLEYYFPWGNMRSAGRAMYDADAKETLESLGIGNPFLDVYAAFKGAKGDTPPKDPFTGFEIYNQLDPPATKAAKTAEWLYNKWAPTMLTRYGAAGYTARIGEKDRYGRTTTPGQAAARWVGFNIIAPSKQQTMKLKKARIAELNSALRQIQRDPTITQKDKAQAQKAFIKKLQEIMRGE